MGGKTFSVSSFSDMQKASNRLKEISAAYTDIYTQLMTAAQTMGDAYVGTDNLDFVNQIKGFTKELKTMADKLSSDADTLDKQRLNYTNKMDENSLNVKKLAN